MVVRSVRKIFIYAKKACWFNRHVSGKIVKARLVGVLFMLSFTVFGKQGMLPNSTIREETQGLL